MSNQAALSAEARTQLSNTGTIHPSVAKNMAVPIEALASFYDFAKAVTENEMTTSPCLRDIAEEDIV